MKYAKKLKEMLEASVTAKRAFMNNASKLEAFQDAVTLLVNAYKGGGRLYVAGNGGSAADAQHLVAEFVSRLGRERAPLPAEALTVDTSILTAIGNDYGYDQLFARQVEGKMRKEDVFLGITTSGNSENINNALKLCKEKGFPTILFAGKDGGEAKMLADYCIIADGMMTSTIQELHIVLCHSLCACVEDEICK